MNGNLFGVDWRIDKHDEKWRGAFVLPEDHPWQNLPAKELNNLVRDIRGSYLQLPLSKTANGVCTLVSAETEEQAYNALQQWTLDVRFADTGKTMPHVVISDDVPQIVVGGSKIIVPMETIREVVQNAALTDALHRGENGICVECNRAYPCYTKKMLNGWN